MSIILLFKLYFDDINTPFVGRNVTSQILKSGLSKKYPTKRSMLTNEILTNLSEENCNFHWNVNTIYNAKEIMRMHPTAFNDFNFHCSAWDNTGFIWDSSTMDNDSMFIKLLI